MCFCNMHYLTKYIVSANSFNNIWLRYRPNFLNIMYGIWANFRLQYHLNVIIELHKSLRHRKVILEQSIGSMMSAALKWVRSPYPLLRS